ncbi:hypothetical protein EW145_g3775 [Phellinidium pouzarii]|uniref:Uncharacterized protein n=1 Tax=Phellinidium pouzarii TaxID=167371 RepID=A0A4S4L657_9AGAM|nr:hypothetical protein EW145_g3775 [Phellinidium pouzarii]
MNNKRPRSNPSVTMSRRDENSSSDIRYSNSIAFNVYAPVFQPSAKIGNTHEKISAPNSYWRPPGPPRMTRLQQSQRISQNATQIQPLFYSPKSSLRNYESLDLACNPVDPNAHVCASRSMVFPFTSQNLFNAQPRVDVGTSFGALPTNNPVPVNLQRRYNSSTSGFGDACHSRLSYRFNDNSVMSGGPSKVPSTLFAQNVTSSDHRIGVAVIQTTNEQARYTLPSNTPSTTALHEHHQANQRHMNQSASGEPNIIKLHHALNSQLGHTLSWQVDASPYTAMYNNEPLPLNALIGSMFMPPQSRVIIVVGIDASLYSCADSDPNCPQPGQKLFRFPVSASQATCNPQFPLDNKLDSAERPYILDVRAILAGIRAGLRAPLPTAFWNTLNIGEKHVLVEAMAPKRRMKLTRQNSRFFAACAEVERANLSAHTAKELRNAHVMLDAYTLIDKPEETSSALQKVSSPGFENSIQHIRVLDLLRGKKDFKGLRWLGLGSETINELFLCVS